MSPRTATAPIQGRPPTPAAYPRGFRGTGRNYFRRVTAAFSNAREIGTWRGGDAVDSQLRLEEVRYRSRPFFSNAAQFKG